MRSQVLSDQLGLESRNGIGTGEYRLCIVLRLVTGATGLALDYESALAAVTPVGRALAADDAVGDEPFGMADLVGGAVADDEVGVEPDWVAGYIGIQQTFLMHPAGLRFIQGNQAGNARVMHDIHDDVIELVIVVAEHIQVQADGDARQHVLEDLMHIIAADIEQMEIAGCGR